MRAGGAMSLAIRNLGYALGAEISGVDLTKSISADDADDIREAFLDHCILLFRGQNLDPQQFIALGRVFGDLDDHSKAKDVHPNYQHILVNRPKTTNPDYYPGETWHSDQCHRPAPAKATLLRSLQIPSLGGDTMFSNMYLAYERLPEKMKDRLSKLDAIHFGGKDKIDFTSPETIAATKKLIPVIAQPLVRTHPETGRKSLYFGDKVKQIAGLSEEDAAPLIDFLCKHIAMPQFAYRHRWQLHDIIIWDNRCTNHLAVGDYDRSQVRHMEKITVKGTPLGYAYKGPLLYDGLPA
jgi:taurine dioxygenase